MKLAKANSAITDQDMAIVNMQRQLSSLLAKQDFTVEDSLAHHDTSGSPKSTGGLQGP